MDSYDVASAWQEIFQTIVQLRKRNIASTLNTLSSSSNITHNAIHRNRVLQYGSDCRLSFCVTGDAHVTTVILNLKVANSSPVATSASLTIPAKPPF